jgi:type III restriction enzyme
MDTRVRGDSERAHSEGLILLTTIQQLYEPRERAPQETDALAAVLGPTGPARRTEAADFADQIARRGGSLLVLNDEAHHTHDEDSKWNKVVKRVHDDRPIVSQLDYSATPRFQKGALFPWTISDYPLKQAIIDGIVKRPYKGVAEIPEAASDHASIKYRGFLAAGVERWREYREQLSTVGKRPLLFIMLNSTEEADDVGDFLRTTYPGEFGSDKTLVIHTDSDGEIKQKDVEGRLGRTKCNGSGRSAPLQR